MNTCKSLLFHGGDTGSIPVRDAKLDCGRLWIPCQTIQESRNWPFHAQISQKLRTKDVDFGNNTLPFPRDKVINRKSYDSPSSISACNSAVATRIFFVTRLDLYGSMAQLRIKTRLEKKLA